jgi:phage terminase large subunit-like protein
MDTSTERTGKAINSNVGPIRVQPKRPSRAKKRGRNGKIKIRRSDKVIAFVECLTNTAGPNAGKAFKLRDWQKEIIQGIYDPVREGNLRAIRTALLTMGRKNGKTELIAALALCHLLGPESELNGEVYSAASDRFQAALVFKAASAMVRADSELSGMVNIIESTKRIVHYASGSFYQALSSESRTKHGFNASCIIYDELAQAPNRELYDVLTTSMGARAEPLILIISTMSNNTHSVMSELVDYGRKLNDGVFQDDSFKAWLFEVPDDADVWDEANWYLANPALGDFRSLEEMRKFAERAKRIPSAEAAFRNLYLNQAVDPNTSFLSPTDWKACGGEMDLEDYIGRKCWGGLDLSASTDLTALALVFESDASRLDCWVFFWTPEEKVKEKERTDRVPYPVWVKQGHMQTTPGRSIRLEAVADKIAELTGQFDVQEIAYDPYRFANLEPHIADRDCDVKMEPFRQGYISMAPAVDGFERGVLNREVFHSNNPVLNWNCANAIVTMDPAGNRKVDKAKSRDRVDGVVALIMAHQRALVAREEQRSVYETRGIRRL